MTPVWWIYVLHDKLPFYENDLLPPMALTRVQPVTHRTSELLPLVTQKIKDIKLTNSFYRDPGRSSLPDAMMLGRQDAEPENPDPAC